MPHTPSLPRPQVRNLRFKHSDLPYEKNMAQGGGKLSSPYLTAACSSTSARTASLLWRLVAPNSRPYPPFPHPPTLRSDNCVFKHSDLPYGENMALGGGSFANIIDSFYGEVRRQRGYTLHVLCLCVWSSLGLDVPHFAITAAGGNEFFPRD